MGFCTTGLSPAVKEAVDELAPKILQICAKAKTEIDAGRAGPQVARWFGAVDTDEVSKSVAGLRAFFNLNSIQLRFATHALNARGQTLSKAQGNERGSNVAAALRPSGGWDDYKNVTKANNTTFEMYLNTGWEKKPTWSSKPLHTAAGRGGKFKTLVHELSHLCLNTEDYKYGAADSILLASNPNPAKSALKNADNWGFFIEEFA